jgi:hypothetical protein
MQMWTTAEACIPRVSYQVSLSYLIVNVYNGSVVAKVQVKSGCAISMINHYVVSIARIVGITPAYRGIFLNVSSDYLC